ncbi:hypothetical protein L2750_20975 [Shewanella submarina]|uniref:Uncharacterized protein n=1 Tax=Shewanella submarina TaxID=2016376 RepID=A0ABV7GBV5_9GAMM|nr:hypothetical protein [Shewanella submarina]MCL1039584.1 hypothetical protein [Shewanella submarina]
MKRAFIYIGLFGAGVVTGLLTNNLSSDEADLNQTSNIAPATLPSVSNERDTSHSSESAAPIGNPQDSPSNIAQAADQIDDRTSSQVSDLPLEEEITQLSAKLQLLKKRLATERVCAGEAVNSDCELNLNTDFTSLVINQNGSINQSELSALLHHEDFPVFIQHVADSPKSDVSMQKEAALQQKMFSVAEQFTGITPHAAACNDSICTVELGYGSAEDWEQAQGPLYGELSGALFLSDNDNVIRLVSIVGSESFSVKQ